MKIRTYFFNDLEDVKINTRFIFISVILLLFLSCTSVKNEKFRTSSIILNEIRFKDKEFKNLIVKSVQDFRKKYSVKNSVVIFELSKKDSITSIYITNLFYFKTVVDEELENNSSYEGGFLHKGILIVSSKNFYSYPNNFYEIKRKNVKFNYIVGNNLDYCNEEIVFQNGIFNKIKTKCTDDIFTD
jgi:hypothetical protein